MKTKQLFLIKSLLCVAAAIAVAGIVPNWKIVFGYGNGGGGGSASAPTCGDAKPVSAPTLLSAVPLGNNQIQLNWSEAANPVSYYLVTFGTKPGEQLYGNPNVGGKGTTNYTIGNLPGGQRFYFKVRAGNGCMPGDYSNEMSAVSGGLAFGGVPAGFQAGVLGAQTEVTPTPTSFVAPTPTPVVVTLPGGGNSGGGFFNDVINFFKHLFGQQ